MRTIETQIPSKHLRTFKFYANHYEIPVNRLMECEAYEQATTINDDPLCALEFIDRLHSEEDLCSITLEFSNQISELLHKISNLLRRPLPELLQGLITQGGLSLADHIEQAFKSGGIENDSYLGAWAVDSIKFASLAKSDSSPMRIIGEGKFKTEIDCWSVFNITPPKRYAEKKPQKHSM